MPLKMKVDSSKRVEWESPFVTGGLNTTVPPVSYSKFKALPGHNDRGFCGGGEEDLSLKLN